MGKGKRIKLERKQGLRSAVSSNTTKDREYCDYRSRTKKPIGYYLDYFREYRGNPISDTPAYTKKMTRARMKERGLIIKTYDRVSRKILRSSSKPEEINYITDSQGRVKRKFTQEVIVHKSKIKRTSKALKKAIRDSHKKGISKVQKQIH